MMGARRPTKAWWLWGFLGLVLLQTWLLNGFHAQLPDSNWEWLTHRGPRLPPPPRSSVTRTRGVPAAPTQRIAVVVPFVGKELPVTFPLFARSCNASAPLVDWLLITSGTNIPPTDARFVPPNMKFINVSVDQLAQLHAEALVTNQAQRPTATKLLRDLIERRPYSLVEFKPAIGQIFSSYLSAYSHWAFGDIDVLMGDLLSWIEPDELSDFDIVTYSFGDQFRMYTRGQWTVHKNNPVVNTVFRDCSHLHDNLLERLERHAHYESAEGCYALRVSQRKDLWVKYTVKVFTDAENVPEWQKEVLLVDGQIRKPGRQLRDLSLAELRALLMPGAQGGLQLQGPLQQPQGQRIVTHRARKQSCMHWVPFQYQTCLEDKIGQEENLLLVNGSVFRQKFAVAGHVVPSGISTSTAAAAAGTTAITTGAFFHFQEWKKQYKSWAAQIPLWSGNLLAAKTGFIPLPPASLLFDDVGVSTSRLDRAARAGLVVQDVDVGALSYCLSSDQRGKCKVRVRSSDFERLPPDDAAAQPPRDNGGRSADADRRVLDVTLLVAADCSLPDALTSNAKRWPGPKRFVLACADREWKALQDTGTVALWQRTGAELLVLRAGSAPAGASPAALLNLALDTTRTRFALPVLHHAWVVGHETYHAVKAAFFDALSLHGDGSAAAARFGPAFALPVLEASGPVAQSPPPATVAEVTAGLRRGDIASFAGRAVPSGDGGEGCGRATAFAHGWLRDAWGRVVNDSEAAALLATAESAFGPGDTQLQRRRLLRLSLRGSRRTRAQSSTTPSPEAALQIGPALALDLATPHGRLMLRFVEEFPAGCWQTLFRWGLAELGVPLWLLPQPAFLFAVPTPAAGEASRLQAWGCGCDESQLGSVREQYHSHIRRAAGLFRDVAKATSASPASSAHKDAGAWPVR